MSLLIHPLKVLHKHPSEIHAESHYLALKHLEWIVWDHIVIWKSNAFLVESIWTFEVWMVLIICIAWFKRWSLFFFLFDYSKEKETVFYFSLKWFLIVAFLLIGKRIWTHSLCICNNEHLLTVHASPISIWDERGKVTWPFGVPFLKLKPFLLSLSVHPTFCLLSCNFLHDTRSSLFVTF